MSEAVAFVGVVGIAIAIGSQIWLILLIMRGSPPLALVAVFVPFFAWHFVIHNWDIAKRPVVCQLLGVLLVVASIFLTP